MGNKTALIAGATGLVGQELCKQLLDSDEYSTIKILTRRTTGLKDYRIEEIITDFDFLENVKEQVKADHIYCTLGTTIKKAGSKEKFKQIDYHYPLKLAEIAIQNNPQTTFLIVTATGASADSAIFYNQVKGEVERDLATIPFPSLHFFRPSLLLGDRKESRFWEDIAKKISGILSLFLIGSDKKVWAIHSEKVAKAMYQVAKTGKEGIHYYEPDRIRALTS